MTIALMVAIVTGPAFALVAHHRGWQPLVERTGSMAPAITPGDLVLVERARADAARPGEIITFADPHVDGRTLTHRVVSVHREAGHLRIVTRGDANRASETWTIAPNGTVGRLHAQVALPDVASALLDRSPARGVVLALLSLLSCALVLRRIWRRPASTSTPTETGACVLAR